MENGGRTMAKIQEQRMEKESEGCVRRYSNGRGVRKEGKEEIGKRRNVGNKTERGGETDIGE